LAVKTHYAEEQRPPVTQILEKCCSLFTQNKDKGYRE